MHAAVDFPVLPQCQKQGSIRGSRTLKGSSATVDRGSEVLFDFAGHATQLYISYIVVIVMYQGGNQGTES